MTLETKRILLIGCNGQLGWELKNCLLPLGRITAVDFPEINLMDPDSIIKWINSEAPEIIINSAAYTDVDQAELETERCHLINSTAPGILAEEAKRIGALLVHYSTDYVFDGKKGAPYLELDQTAPLNFYGKSKLGGEKSIGAVGGLNLIFRTSWLYSLRVDCFVTKVLHWAKNLPTISIAADQIGSPTWAKTLAFATIESLILWERMDLDWRRERCGLYHVAGEGAATRYEWARRILDLDPGKNNHSYRKLIQALSADFNNPAERPKNSSLDCNLFQRSFDVFIPNWRESLRLALSGT